MNTPPPHAYDWGLSDHAKESDNINSFWHHSAITNGRNIDFWEGILTVKTNAMVGILTDNPFLHQNSLDQPSCTGFVIDMCIIFIIENALRWWQI